MSSSSSESSQHLKYPTSDSSTVLDLNTLIMRSTNPRRQAEDTSSSLDESTYELLGESTCSISDDEGNTASIASTDVHTPDDVSAFSDNDDDDDDDFERYTTESSQQLEQPSAYNAELAFAHQIRSGEDSTLTEVPPHMEDSESSRLIKLNEEPKDDRDTIHAWKHIRIYDQEAEMPDVLKPYECSKIRLTVRAALSERYMPVSGAFRILYVGDYQEWAEKDISSQIGAALSTSPGPSRSIMVGGQMEPCGPVIDVHRCIDIKTLGQRRNLSQVILTLDDIHGTRFTFGPKQAVRSHGPAAFPDLVIFCYGTASNFAIEVERFCPVREAFQRHQVPCLDVAQVRPWNYLPSTTYDMKSLRLCVEGRHNDSTDYKLEEVLPIDHYTFCQLDPSQLNRHLAYITPPTNSRTEAQVWTLSSCLSNRIKKTMNGFSSPGKFAVMFMALTMMISMFLLKSGYSPVIGGTQFSVTTPSNTPSSTSASSSIAASSITVADAAYTSMLSALHADPLIRKELTEVITHDVTSKLPKKPPKESKPAGFDIQTTGDHQFVLSPSKDFVNKKRKPQLQIQVSRHSKAIPIRYIRTVGGVYVVILEQEYPRGTFNVSIATHSKPLLQQTFKITLGYNKSKLTQIFDTIKQDIISAKDHIWNVSSTVTHEVHQRCMGWEDDTTIWKKKKTSRFNQNAPERSQALKKATQHRLRAGGALLSKAHRATWMEIRKATAPIRTSQAVLRARKNALRLRCKLEKAVGFSGKDDGEKEQTWACSKVQKKTQ